jgi:hypothetical protein
MLKHHAIKQILQDLEYFPVVGIVGDQFDENYVHDLMQITVHDLCKYTMN